MDTCRKKKIDNNKIIFISLQNEAGCAINANNNNSSSLIRPFLIYSSAWSMLHSTVAISTDTVMSDESVLSEMDAGGKTQGILQEELRDEASELLQLLLLLFRSGTRMFVRASVHDVISS